MDDLLLFKILAIAGALAWLQPIIKWIYSFFTKPRLTVVTGEYLELGYTSFGPIINLNIAFSAEKKDVLINSVILSIIHETKETHILRWEWFEEELLSMDIPDKGTIPYKKRQSAIAIKVLQENIVEKRVGLQETDFKLKYKKLKAALDDKFNDFINQKVDMKLLKTTSEYTSLIALFENSFFWKQGKYEAIFEIHSLNNKDTFRYKLKFNLSTSHVNTLSGNKEITCKMIEKQYLDEKLEINEIWGWAYVNKSEDN